jgi:tetratricopeptide (TPR) repeat protein
LVLAARLAEQLDDTDTVVQAALGLPVGQSFVGNDETKRVVTTALDRIGQVRAPSRARLLAALAIAHDAATEWQARRELALEAVDTVRQTDDDAAFVDVLTATHLSVATPDRLAQAVDDIEHAVVLADQIGDPVRQAGARNHLIWARYQECDIAGVNAVVAEMEQITERVGLPYQQHAFLLATISRLQLEGHASEAEAANERMLEVGTAAAIPEALGTYGALLRLIRSHQGRVDEIADFFLDIARDNPSIPTLRTSALALLCELGRIDEARERLAAEAATGFVFPYDITWLNTMGNLLDAAATTDDRTAAHALVEKVAPYQAQVVAPTGLVRGAIARPLARAATVLGDHEQAEEWFAIAHDIHARLQAPFWIALGQLDHADLCLARRADGDLERARDLATQAAATAAEFGCGGLTRRAETMLARL